MRYLVVSVLGMMVIGCTAGTASRVGVEQYLCVAKSVVRTTTPAHGQRTTAYNFEGTDSKYMFSNSGGTWKAEGIGDASWQFNHCDASGLLCSARARDNTASEAVFEGAISRNAKSGAFYATGIKGDASSSHVFTMTGSCSRYLVAF
jgi:hypothetical protein